MNKFTFGKEEIFPLISSVIIAVDTKQLPVLQYLHVEIKGNQLKVTATDLERELVATGNVAETNEGIFLLPARKFRDIISALPDDKPITLEVADKIVVKCGRSKYKLETVDSSQYPNIETWDKMHGLTISSSKLMNMFKTTSYTMANQDVRYYLNGMNIEIDNCSVRTVATDGHRLAICEEKVESGDIKATVIVPRKAIQDLESQIPKHDTDLTVSLGTNHFKVEWEGFTYCTKLIDGKYPDYRRVMPKEEGAKIKLTLDVVELQDKLSRCKILANDKFKGVRLTLSKGMIKLNSNNPEQEEAEEVIENVPYDGPELVYGFNVEYLEQTLRTIITEKVLLILGDATTSAIIKSPGNTNSQHVCMPMRC